MYRMKLSPSTVPSVIIGLKLVLLLVPDGEKSKVKSRCSSALSQSFFPLQHEIKVSIKLSFTMVPWPNKVWDRRGLFQQCFQDENGRKSLNWSAYFLRIFQLEKVDSKRYGNQIFARIIRKIANFKKKWSSIGNGPDGIWTHDLLVKSRSLCRSKLRAQRWLSLQRHKYFRLWVTDLNHFQSIVKLSTDGLEINSPRSERPLCLKCRLSPVSKFLEESLGLSLAVPLFSSG